MAMTLQTFQAYATVQAATTWPLPATVTGANVSANRFAQQVQMLFSLTNGTGTSKADTTIFQERQLAAGATESLNFFDGSVLAVDGSATGLQTVKALIIWQVANPDATTSASSFTVGGAAATQLVLNLGSITDTYTGYINAAPFWAGRPAGYTVTNLLKLLKVLNNDGANKLTYMLLCQGNHV